jgi:hypothetical protein
LPASRYAVFPVFRSRTAWASIGGKIGYNGDEGGISMDKKLIYKMVAGCLGQYGHDGSLIKPGSREFEELYRSIEEKKNEDAEADLHEIVEDAVYGFVTGSPYF